MSKIVFKTRESIKEIILNAAKKAISAAAMQSATIVSVAKAILRCVERESGVKFILFRF